MVGPVVDDDGGRRTVVIDASRVTRRGTATAETTVGISAGSSNANIELPWIYRCWCSDAVVADEALRWRAASGGASNE